MARKVIIGVMGPGAFAGPEIIKNANKIGRMIAKNQWILLTGGRDQGVMNAASKGAKEAGGTTLGILPGSDYQAVSEFVDIPILSGMGSGRNYMNVLSSRVIVVVGMGPGTASEAALGLKLERPVIFYCPSDVDFEFFKNMKSERPQQARTIAELQALIMKLLE